jgi:GNAT superfamily N-acetyltransferase
MIYAVDSKKYAGFVHSTKAAIMVGATIVVGGSEIEDRVHLSAFLKTVVKHADLRDPSAKEVYLSAKTWMTRRVPGNYWDFVLRAKVSEDPYDDNLMGWTFFSLRAHPSDPSRSVAYLVALHTLDGHRGKGVGRTLVHKVASMAGRSGAECVVTQCRLDLVGFYSAMGFSVEQAGLDRGAFVHMKLEL